VLIAYGDVEDALTDLHALTGEVANYRQAAAASQNYLRLAEVQYRNGLVDYLTVIDAERTLLANQLALAQALNSQMSASIHLIKALGVAGTIGREASLETNLRHHPLSSWFSRWQWNTDIPRIIGSVKSITTSTEPSTGTLTVSSQCGSAIGRSFPGRQEVGLVNVHRMDLARVVEILQC